MVVMFLRHGRSQRRRFCSAGFSHDPLPLGGIDFHRVLASLDFHPLHVCRFLFRLLQLTHDGRVQGLVRDVRILAILVIGPVV